MRRITRLWPYLALLVVLVAADAVVAAGDVLRGRGHPAFQDVRWAVETDAGWLELFRAGQLLVAAGILAVVGLRRRRASVLVACAAILVTLVADDLLQWHERGGEWLASNLGLTARFGLRAVDFGELLTWGALAAVLGGGLVVSMVRSSPPARAGAALILLGVGALAVFAVGVDAVHVVLTHQVSSRTYYLLTLLEAGGQTASASLVLVVAVLLARRGLPVWSRPLERGTSDRTVVVAGPGPGAGPSAASGARGPERSP